MILLKKCLAEYIGAFSIVFCGCGAIAINKVSDGSITHVGIAITFGLTVMILIYAVGHISKAHFNPAVTIAFATTRNCTCMDIFPYIISQVLGATTGSIILLLTLKQPLLTKVQSDSLYIFLGVTQPFDNLFLTAFIWEFLLTFLLMFVIMAVATDDRVAGEFAGLAIGSTIMLEALFAGHITGASMNPARSLGPALVTGQWKHFSAYIFGPIIGAIAGAFFYKYISSQ